MPELCFEGTLECLQMVLPAQVTPRGPTVEIVPLSAANAPEMVALTDLAFPGFFRSRTCEMGSYHGVRANGVLVAMGGERLRLEGYPEISGVCTHPLASWQGPRREHHLWHIVQEHRRDVCPGST
jgi:hypothetical protein